MFRNHQPRALAQGAPVVTDGNPATFTWTDGVITADISQAARGAQDLIANQIKNGAINSDSSVTVNADNTFTLHITKSIFWQTVTVDCTGSLAASIDSAGNPTTTFQMTNGTVDSGGLASTDQITAQLTTWVQNWEKQAQLEPKQPTVSLPGE